jgi:hypothetical protein
MYEKALAKLHRSYYKIQDCGFPEGTTCFDADSIMNNLFPVPTI